MPAKKRNPIPHAIELLLAHREREIENTPESRRALARAIYFYEFRDILSAADLQRAGDVLGDLQRRASEPADRCPLIGT
jgi:hypothetical protein